MLLDDEGLNIGTLSPSLAEALGSSPGEEGSNVLAEPIVHGRWLVQCRDWLYCLAKSPATHLRRTLVDGYGSQPERFIAAVEQGVDDAGETAAIPPMRLNAQAVAPDVLLALGWAEGIAREKGLKEINDALLTLALLRNADEQLTEMLQLWAGEDGLRTFIRLLELEIGPEAVVEPFGEDGSLNQAAFSPGGRKFCNRLVEEAASLGVKKVTTRHMLYTLLGNEAGLLTVALAVRGINVKRDLHALLVRELTRPGRRRSEGLALRRDTVFDAAQVVFKHAARLARERGAAAGESDIARAFAKKQGSELTRLCPPEAPLDLPGLVEYIDASDPADEEESPGALRRFTIGEIRQQINDRIVGQEAAVEELLPLIKRLHFGLPRDGRPAGVFLFLGPTGTGKTQLAKELARYVYGDEEMMIYLEMGQFQAKEAINSFIGAPPGYVGYGDGKLTNGLRDKPECVVLFDEIEKAETQVFDALLRFADEGVISDPAGPVRDGRKCIIVMTTNAGQEWLRAHLKADPAAFNAPAQLARDLFDAAADELRARGFRVEFLGRVDKRITFLPFSQESYRQIVDNVIEAEAEKFLRHKGVILEVTQPARALIAEFAYEQSLDVGARGAPRAVNDLVVSPVIDALTSDESGAGSTATRVVARKSDSGGIELEIQNGHGTSETATVTSRHEA